MSGLPPNSRPGFANPPLTKVDNTNLIPAWARSKRPTVSTPDIPPRITVSEQILPHNPPSIGPPQALIDRSLPPNVPTQPAAMRRAAAQQMTPRRRVQQNFHVTEEAASPSRPSRMNYNATTFRSHLENPRIPPPRFEAPQVAISHFESPHTVMPRMLTPPHNMSRVALPQPAMPRLEASQVVATQVSMPRNRASQMEDRQATVTSIESPRSNGPRSEAIQIALPQIGKFQPRGPDVIKPSPIRPTPSALPSQLQFGRAIHTEMLPAFPNIEGRHVRTEFYSSSRQAADYANLLAGSEPEETWQSRRKAPMVAPSSVWQKADTFSDQWYNAVLLSYRQDAIRGELLGGTEEEQEEERRRKAAGHLVGVRVDLEISRHEFESDLLRRARDMVLRDNGIMPRNALGRLAGNDGPQPWAVGTKTIRQGHGRRSCRFDNEA